MTRTLESTATDLQQSGWDTQTGAGLLNMAAAVNLARTITPETQVFSGAQLIQQVNGSFDNSTWKSTDGAVASERLAWSWSDFGHTALDVIGTIDPTPISDGVNAAWYTVEGDYTNAAISAVSMLPGGDVAKAGKWAAKGLKAGKSAKTAKGLDKTANVATRAESDAKAINLGQPVNRSVPIHKTPSNREVRNEHKI
ncbi:hypothetical protein [Leptolyngbya sp. FACHB-17]|uniref:hypothetical protein n=1 Tax=unclassified Leptolyngbya TaxID=2650499 RepID=UPI0018EFF933|nr:hypothetical protein [Leptolyngbya sp. FACHB-17]